MESDVAEHPYGKLIESAGGCTVTEYESSSEHCMMKRTGLNDEMTQDPGYIGVAIVFGFAGMIQGSHIM